MKLKEGQEVMVMSPEGIACRVTVKEQLDVEKWRGVGEFYTREGAGPLRGTVTFDTGDVILQSRVNHV